MVQIEQYYREQDAKRRKSVVSWFSYACIAANLLSILPDLYYGLWFTVSLGVLTAIFFGLMNLINLFYSTDVAANALLLVGNIIVFVFSNLIGEASNSHLILIIGVLFVPFMLDVRRKCAVVFHATFPFFLLALLEFTQFAFIPQLPEITPEHQEVFGYFNIAVMLLISPSIIFAIIKTHTANYDMLLRENTEKELKNQELAKTNAELDKFVYSVSHDLRSPIASMLGLVNLSKLETDLATLQHYENLKEKSLRKLDSFIHDILDFSRNARTEIQRENINWELFIPQQIVQHQHSEDAQAVKITFEVQQNVPYCYTDAYRLAIIFNNLLSNAIRYKDKLKTEQTIHLNVLVTDENIVIECIDNGIGIGTEHLENIFKMFYRASADSKGSGLGLYIVAETIQKLNGTFSVKSALGQGTTFIVQLPNYDLR